MLKLLADDRHCGRVIGREGKVIKKIREETNTKIIVSGLVKVISNNIYILYEKISRRIVKGFISMFESIY